MTIKRFVFGRDYANNIGAPGITEMPDGDYMLVADHERLMRACELHNETYAVRAQKAETELRDLKKHLGK